MTRSSAVRPQDIGCNGIVVPPFAHQSGMITNAASLVRGIMGVAPCALYIEKVVVLVTTAFTHASSKLNFGSIADEDAYLDAMVTYNIGAGLFEFDPASYLGTVGRTIPRGASFGFTMDAADTTGVLVAAAILRPI